MTPNSVFKTDFRLIQSLPSLWQALRRFVRRSSRRLEVLQDGRAHLRRHHSQPKIDKGQQFSPAYNSGFSIANVCPFLYKLKCPISYARDLSFDCMSTGPQITKPRTILSGHFCTGCSISSPTLAGLTLILAFPLSARFCCGRWDFGRICRATGQNG